MYTICAMTGEQEGWGRTGQQKSQSGLGHL